MPCTKAASPCKFAFFTRACARARCPCALRFFALFRRARFTIVNIIIIITIMRTPTPLHIERHACAPQHER
jgi:hypothetical protein